METKKEMTALAKQLKAGTHEFQISNPKGEQGLIKGNIIKLVKVNL